MWPGIHRIDQRSACGAADHRDGMVHSATSSVASLAIWNNPVARASSLQRPSLTHWLETIPCAPSEEADEEAGAGAAASEAVASEAAATAASMVHTEFSHEGSYQAEPSEPSGSIIAEMGPQEDQQEASTPGLPISVNCRMLGSPHGVRTWSDNDLRSAVDVRGIAANWPPNNTGPAAPFSRSSKAPAAPPSARVQLGEHAHCLSLKSLHATPCYCNLESAAYASCFTCQPYSSSMELAMDPDNRRLHSLLSDCQV